jgi:predicted nucleic acid-binding protein
VSRWIVDASLSLGWYLKDEADRSYNLEVLAGLKENDALIPFLWVYEVSNGLLMAHRRKRITTEELSEILGSLKSLPITVDPPDAKGVLELPMLALKHQLTVYDAAYLELALRLTLPIATKDAALQRAMESCGIEAVQPGKLTE